jgi:mono/diheme cytochrome c family protein
MTRRVLIIGVLVLLAFGVTIALAQEGSEAGDPVQGAALYAEYCLACHGPQGEARASQEAFASAIRYSLTFADIVASGVEGTYMVPYSQANGGPLTDQDILDIQAYAETWQTEGFQPPLALSVSPDLTEEQAQGARLFFFNCAGCHGREGLGRDLPGFPPIAAHVDVLAAARRGGTDTVMPPFAGQYGGPLTDDELTAMMAYVGTWERPAEMAVQAESGPKGVGMLIMLAGLGTLGLLVGGAVLSRRTSAPQK